MVPTKRGVRKRRETIFIDDDIDDDMVEENGDTIDKNRNEGVGNNMVPGNVDWDKLPDLAIICQTICGPNTCLYQIAEIGNMGGSIYNDKVKTFNPGVLLNDEVVNFIV